jgi:hypothetical protein
MCLVRSGQCSDSGRETASSRAGRCLSSPTVGEVPGSLAGEVNGADLPDRGNNAGQAVEVPGIVQAAITRHAA